MSVRWLAAGVLGGLALLGGALGAASAAFPSIETDLLVHHAEDGAGAGRSVATAVALGDRATIEALDGEERLHRFEVEVLAPLTTEPADGGMVRAIAAVRVGYVAGPDPGLLSLLALRGTLADGTVAWTHDHYCGPLDDPLMIEARLQRGAVVEGLLCWQLPLSEVAGLTLAVETTAVEPTAADVRHLALS